MPVTLPAPSPDPSLHLRPFPTAAAIMHGDAAATADAALAHAALGRALAGLVRTSPRIASEPAAIGRWENEGGQTALVTPVSLESERRAVLGRDRRAWAAYEVRQGEVADAARAYTRVLRQGGVPLAATLLAVASAVRQHTTRLPTDAGAAVQRDAARSCLEAYYAP